MVGQRQRQRFEQTALPYLDAVHNFAFSLTHNHALAEDLVQETFLNAYRSFARFQAGTNIKAWLFRICKNAFIDGFRARQRRPKHQEIDITDPPTMDRSHEVRAFETRGIEDEDIFLDMFGDEVNRFLKELPEEFRSALLLCDLEGLAYEEIAQVLEVPIGTVRSRISRARSFLRERLEEYARELGYMKEPSSQNGES